MGVDVNYNTIDYRNQKEFDYFFATAFDRYDRNRDGVIDYREFQPLINDMCQMISQKYGYGPTVDKIRAAWSSLDYDKNGYITRNEFSTRARYEVERILTQPDYIPIGYVPNQYGAAYGNSYPSTGPSGFPQPAFTPAYPQGGYPPAYPQGGYPSAYPQGGYPPAYPQGGYPQNLGYGYNQGGVNRGGFSSNIQGQG